jgi:hypothetical protein
VSDHNPVLKLAAPFGLPNKGYVCLLTRGEWPDFFVVGVQKAGTTSLWHDLDHHPDIFMSRLREPWYFAETSPLNTAVSIPPVKDKGVYLRLFAPATREQLRGQATAGYFWGEQTPQTSKARASSDGASCPTSFVRVSSGHS